MYDNTNQTEDTSFFSWFPCTCTWFEHIYCIYTYTKGLNISSYNLRGSHLKYNCHNTKYYDMKIL